MNRPKRLPAAHHVAGYCSKSSLDGDQPTPKSFRIDPDGISVNHLEWFDENDLGAAMLGLQQWKLKQKNFTTRVSGRFAVLLVGKIEGIGAAVVEDSIENAECPLCSDPSHSLIQHPDQGVLDAAREFKSRLVLLVDCVCPARPPTSTA